MRKYSDFDLQVIARTNRQYEVRVQSTAGEATESVGFPLDSRTLEQRLLALDNALLRSGIKRRLTPSSRERLVQQFGEEMFEFLFSGDVRVRFDTSRQQAASEGKGLRIRLRIEASELLVLPWEFLFDPRDGDFLVLSSTTPIVRYVALPREVPPLQSPPPLRILALAASPKGLEDLDVGREKERLRVALEPVVREGLIELRWISSGNSRALQKEIAEGSYNIFHFIGHGGFDKEKDEGFILLEGDRGDPFRLTARKLARLVADRRSMRVVVLNCCEGATAGSSDVFSSTASVLTRKGVPAVLGMQNAITDRAAIELAFKFYGSLAMGMPLELAVSEARKAIDLSGQDTFEWGVPVLFLRAQDGNLFEIPSDELESRRDDAETLEDSSEVSRPVSDPLVRLEEIRRESEALGGSIGVGRVAEDQDEVALEGAGLPVEERLSWLAFDRRRAIEGDKYQESEAIGVVGCFMSCIYVVAQFLLSVFVWQFFMVDWNASTLVDNPRYVPNGMALGGILFLNGVVSSRYFRRYWWKILLVYLVVGILLWSFAVSMVMISASSMLDEYYFLMLIACAVFLFSCILDLITLMLSGKSVGAYLLWFVVLRLVLTIVPLVISIGSNVAPVSLAYFLALTWLAGQKMAGYWFSQIRPS